MALSRRRVILYGLLVVGILFALFLTLPITLTPSIRHRLLAALNERFDSKVEIASLRLAVLPHVRVEGDELVLHHKGRTDVAPLIAIKSFSAEASLFGLLMPGRLRLKTVHLVGLKINIPPGGLKLQDGSKEGAGSDNANAAAGTAAAANAAAGNTTAGKDATSTDPAKSREPRKPGKKPPLIVDEIISEQAELTILRKDPEKKPRVFAIHHLTMNDVGADVPWAFRATLRNPTPPGDIQTQGTFGPWSADDPSTTPLRGLYTFRDADLGVFKGIGGKLDSEGQFSGVLEKIEVDGKTKTPNFTITVGNNPVPLETQYHAIVDATNGNTFLKPVHAKLANTPIEADGGVYETEGVKGRTVQLDVVMKDGRIEDVLRLAIKGPKPPMAGVLNLKTKFLLPPGEADSMERLQLDGDFHIATARFTTGGVQGKINELSRRSRGDMEEAPKQVASDLRGRFVMKDGTIRFASISFTVPGARIALAGSYGVRGEKLDFEGTATLDAKLSEMTTGYKSVLLKVVDPLFRRKGNTVIPLTIGGTVDDPKFGLDIKRALTRK
jgi:hypothetical protein